ncbi:sensor histidine kinase [Nocardioides sp. URHA0032]|uniref:sensor histidine kinase n=1 Tax=Nocardioides sp. URHA0032 TaxID=1380388 RepID=UPI0006872594|nr:GAF domain-containing sensor histidine kinase [Nocardioides sp. URHA0032]
MPDADFVRPVRGSRWSDSQSRDALQAIAEGVSEIAGFDLVGISAARDDGYLHTLVVVGPEEARATLLDSLAPTQALLDQLALAEDWGPLKWIPHDKLILDIDTWGWFSDAPRENVPDGAWHPEDSLVAPLEDDDGRFLGFLGIELPRDGLVPDAEKRRQLEVYVRLATHAIRAALERERLAEQVRLATAAADIVRMASGSDTADEILAVCGREITKGFRADSLWLQRIGLDRRCAGPLYVDGGPTVRLPAGVRALVTAHAQRAWERQCVGVIAPERPVPGALAADQVETVLEFLAGVGVESLMFVPIGAGPDCFGVIGLTRGHRGAEWSETEAATALEIARDLGRSMREHELVNELRQVSDYRARMVATVAHELKNPVSAVLGYAELLDGDPDLGESSRTAAAAIRRGGERLARVVDDLLVLHSTTETEPVTGARVDLGALAREVVELNAALAAGLGIDLRVAVPDAPVVVCGADGEIEHVVSNLVSNALKYTDRGGSVVVTVAVLGDEAELTVADDGIGMSAEDSARVFEEFYRSSDPAATAKPGTGLGLAIVRRVLERYRGRIEVESELGRGSTFRVGLPLG